jgi:hypothetical protein
MKSSLKFHASSFFLIALSAPVSAQDYSPPQIDYVGIQLSAVPFNLAVSNIENNVSTKPTSSPKSTSVSTSYVPFAARTRQNLAKFVTKTRETDPQGAAQMEQLFASTDIIGQIRQGIAPYGLRVDNVADAYAVYWISAWEASRGIVGGQETRERAQAVKGQAARALTSSPEFARATGAQMQEFAEAMLIQAAMISSHMDAAAGNPAQLRAVSAAVLKGAKASGLDLDTMELTPNGFAKSKSRKRSDAGGAVDGGVDGDAAAGDAVLASNDTPTGDKAPRTRSPPTPSSPQQAAQASAACSSSARRWGRRGDDALELGAVAP